MSFRVIYQTLIKLGVPDVAFCCLNNDLLLNGKKFVGSEKVYRGSAYTECLFINLKYLEEKELFDQIYVGKKANVRPITGILDEYPNITKEDFVKTYLAEFKTYLSEHFKVTFNS
jgi:lipoate-protein ligase A